MSGPVARPASRTQLDAPTPGRAWRRIWFWLLLGWTVSAADRAVTGPVVTWMIDHKVDFFASAPDPHALGGLIGGLFFAGYMLTQFSGGYLGDRFGHRSMIVVSLVWAGIATLLTGILSGLVLFIVIRVVTGLGEGAYYSNDRSLIADTTPERERSLGMGVVITGLAIGITIATLCTPYFIDFGGVFLPGREAWRMCFLLLGSCTLALGLATAVSWRRHLHLDKVLGAARHLAGYSLVTLALIMAIYFAGTHYGLSAVWIAVLQVVLAIVFVSVTMRRKGGELAPVLRNRDLLLIYVSFIAILWNLWFFGFWSVSIVAGAAKSSFLQAALIATFNAGAGILGFPAGGWLSDRAVRRGWGRKPMLLSFTAIQAALTLVFAAYISLAGRPSMWVMGVLLFTTSLFFNALQPVSQALAADITEPTQRGSMFGMMNLIGETGAVLSPAIGGVLRDATGNWDAAVWLDGGLIVAGLVVLTLVRERRAPLA